MKILEIENCSQCINYKMIISDDGIDWCKAKDKKLEWDSIQQMFKIPDWCPLPEAVGVK